jgi:hypothetical protein
MKFTKIFGTLAVTGLVFATGASATTLEVKGVKQTAGTSIEATLKAGTSLLQTDTSGFFANTCTASTLKATTETDTTDPNGVTTKATAPGTSAIAGAVTTLSWGTVATPCTKGNPTVHAPGTLSVEWIKSTTSATVKSINAEWTVPSSLGLLTCQTPFEGTDLGTLTGVAAGNATIDINIVLNCGITAKWTGTYTVINPVGLGVVE